jgi:hypothetical protein
VPLPASICGVTSLFPHTAFFPSLFPAKPIDGVGTLTLASVIEHVVERISEEIARLLGRQGKLDDGFDLESRVLLQALLTNRSVIDIRWVDWVQRPVNLSNLDRLAIGAVVGRSSRAPCAPCTAWKNASSGRVVPIGRERCRARPGLGLRWRLRLCRGLSAWRRERLWLRSERTP